MKRLFAIYLFLCPFSLLAQSYFDKDKETVKLELGQYVHKNKSLNPELTISDSSVILAITEPGNHRIRFKYGFDRESGKCNALETVAHCSACYKKHLDSLLEQKNHNWKKLNENQYVSRYEDQLLLETAIEEGDYSFILFKTQWTRDFYDLLIRE